MLDDFKGMPLARCCWVLRPKLPPPAACTDFAGAALRPSSASHAHAALVPHPARDQTITPGLNLFSVAIENIVSRKSLLDLDKVLQELSRTV